MQESRLNGTEQRSICDEPSQLQEDEKELRRIVDAIHK